MVAGLTISPLPNPNLSLMSDYCLNMGKRRTQKLFYGYSDGALILFLGYIHSIRVLISLYRI